MQGFASMFGYEPGVSLYNEQATAQAVLENLKKCAQELQAGDILFLSYSGHGGQVDNPEFYTPDDKGPDETWCLYDRQLLDDELFDAFCQFREGVRILVVSDSCHSGTVTRDIPNDPVEMAIEAALRSLNENPSLRPKSMKASTSAYSDNFNAVYKPIQEALKAKALQGKSKVLASVKLFAACQDNQVAYDGDNNGRFTAMLKALLDKGLVDENTGSEKLLALIKNQYQYPTPNLLDYGSIIPAFDNYFPFMVEIPGAAEIAGYRYPPSEESTPITWRNILVNDAPPTPQPNPLVAVVAFLEGENSLDKLTGLLPNGVKSVHFQQRNTFLVEFQQQAFTNVWDAIYLILEKAEQENIQIEIEPSQTAPTPVAEKEAGAKSGGESFDYLPQWPPVSTGGIAPFAWHLGNDHAQLDAARRHVMAEMEAGRISKKVRIAHFDTGYFPSHPAIWNNPNILRDLAKSFVPGETGNKALDIYYGDGEVQGHGLGTLAILAGWKLEREHADGSFSGYFGAAPCAEVIPMRLGDGVIILDSETFVEAIEYAIETGCEVITMSRGGKPSLRMAKAVNKAYEAGIVIVSAAGNSIVGGPGFAKFGPRTVVWPARFARVIAACGVCQNHFPYDFCAQEKFADTKGADNDRMQGNWGPEAAMRYALAAYTPNVPWAVYRKTKYFSLDGGGTSSATPQIAAAAALYIMKHRDEMQAKGYYSPGQQWKKVEAVRQALYQTAYLAPNFPEAMRYYGNGILKAMDALNQPVSDIPGHLKAPEAESSWLGWREAIGLFIDRRRAAKTASATLKKTIALEMAHVLMSDPGLASLHDRLPYEGAEWDEALTAEVVNAVKGSAFCSEALKKEL